MIKEELEKTAFLARIEVREEEKEKYVKDLSQMLELAEILQEPDVSGLKPTTHVTSLRNVWRDDIVKPCPKEIIEQMINAAPQKEGSFYKVAKVIEAE
ncbi:MAG: Asp-tRNA(Asn)/Glu-tRNA(Gln) amidotransferase subunit GatC [Endomicrobia bacterium]|nr:Asp-tRNA(Asn)/Glu-tRNA(Gln) amidotransferase subunit GatC [Endomicrobiia bacterium]